MGTIDKSHVCLPLVIDLSDSLRESQAAPELRFCIPETPLKAPRARLTSTASQPTIPYRIRTCERAHARARARALVALSGTKLAAIDATFAPARRSRNAKRDRFIMESFASGGGGEERGERKFIYINE